MQQFENMQYKDSQKELGKFILEKTLRRDITSVLKCIKDAVSNMFRN